MSSLQKEKSPYSPSNHISSSEYVDIFYIGNKIGLFFKNAKRFLLRNIKLVSVLIVLGFALGLALHYFATPYFTSTMVISTGDLKPVIARTLISRLEADIDDESFGSLSKKLNIPLQTAQTVKELSITGYVEEIKEETEQDSTLSQITLELTDVTKFVVLQEALVKYVESTEAFKLNQNLNRTQTLAFMDRINTDLRKIDSLKTLSKENEGSGTVVIYGENERAAELFRQGNDLYKQQLELENYLVLGNRVRVIAPFTPRSKASGPSRALYAILGALVGLGLAIVIANNRTQKAHSI